MLYSKAREQQSAKLGLSMPLIRRVFWGMALTPASLLFSPTPAFSSCAQQSRQGVSLSLCDTQQKGGPFGGLQFLLPGNPTPS